MEQEIKFLRLPSMIELENQAERTDVKFTATLQNRYRQAQWSIYRAQRKAAVVALEVCRPDQYRRFKETLRFKMEAARADFEGDCVNEFSEYCTKGL